jgi:hypothetical protein
MVRSSHHLLDLLHMLLLSRDRRLHLPQLPLGGRSLLQRLQLLYCLQLLDRAALLRLPAWLPRRLVELLLGSGVGFGDNKAVKRSDFDQRSDRTSQRNSYGQPPAGSKRPPLAL